MSRVSLGIYAGSRHFYLTELEKTIGAIRLVATTVVQCAPASSDESALIKQTLATTLENRNVQSKTVCMALPDRENFLRYFEMPIVPAKNRVQAARFEAQKYISVESQELSSAMDIHVDKKNEKIKVVYFALKNKLVEALAQSFADKNVGVLAIEPSSLALTRYYYHTQKQAAQNADAFINICEDETANIVIAKKGILMLSRFFVVQKSAAQLGELDFDPFISEIRLALSYFAKNFREEIVSRLVLFANGQRICRGWSQRLKSELDIPVEAFSLGPAATTDSDRLSSEACISYGLALKGLDAGALSKLTIAPAVNRGEQSVLPVTVWSWEQKKEFLQKWSPGTLAAVAVLIGVLHAALIFHASSKERQAGELSTKLPALFSVPQKPMAESDLTKVEKELARQSQTLAEAMDRRVYLTSKMSELAHKMPAKIKLNHLEYRHKDTLTGKPNYSLLLSGYVLDGGGSELDLVTTFMNLLKGDAVFMEGFDEIKIASVQKNPMIAPNLPVSMTFSIECFKHHETKLRA